ncbi:HAD family hydrolase [Pseudonocardia spinosispora]|uniref:HAD family hydrolase n=1 Tax=Pseudonocardia spinosispora TaxID=103441 RepID=UPI0003FC85C8|nr:HAD family hydrolase [Pseudonocardia spinosispora]
MTTLVVFDIDGTLLNSVEQHHQAFEDALADLELTAPGSGWGEYTHHTDSWIFRELFRRDRGRTPTRLETDRFARALLDRYTAITATAPPPEIQGASTFLAALDDSADHRIAYATGGMREVAVRKLATVAPSDDSAVVATASEHTFREHVVRDAIDRAGGDRAPKRIIAVGDGTWDVRAAVALDIEFIGIGDSPQVFGPWFPRTHLAASFDEIDLTRSYTLRPPSGSVPPEPGRDTRFVGDSGDCPCWD